MFPPERIVRLTEETVETLCLLGEQDRIVGISGYCVRPPEARRDKPRISAFTSADIPKRCGDQLHTRRSRRSAGPEDGRIHILEIREP